MKKLFSFCFVAALFCGCDKAWPEIVKDHETVDIYVGLDPAVDKVNPVLNPRFALQVQAAIDDINAKVRHKNGKALFKYAGTKSALYGADTQGLRFVYWVYPCYTPKSGNQTEICYPTQAGRDLAKKYTPKHSGREDSDSIQIMLTLAVCWDPNDSSCRKGVQEMVSHEFGHACSAVHLPDGEHDGVMASSAPVSKTLTKKDVADWCSHELACDPNYPAATSVARLSTADTDQSAEVSQPGELSCATDEDE